MSRAESDAHEYFSNPAEIARQQKSELFELRATMSRPQVLAAQAHRDEVPRHDGRNLQLVLQSFDTADLKEAKVLLDELSRQAPDR
jgi:hypothetical protein